MERIERDPRHVREARRREPASMIATTYFCSTKIA